MQCLIGCSDYELTQKNIYVPVVYDTSELTNGHMMISGSSGSGKSHLLNRLVESALVSRNVKVHIFDIHSEYNFSSGVAAPFGEMSSFGYNPLRVDSDPNSGGVRRCISAFISIINDSGTKLGSRQEPALRYLLEELFAAHGFDADKHSTWKKKELNEDQWWDFYNSGKSRYGYQPTLMDLLLVVEAKILHVFTGGNSEAARALRHVNAKAKKLGSLKKELARSDSMDDAELKDLESSLDTAKLEAIDAYTNYINTISSGTEIWDLLKYKSTDTLMALKERLHSISHTGIFAPNPPPFRDSSLCVYQLKDLRQEEASMLIQLRMRALLEEHKRLGQTDHLRTVIVLEEAHHFLLDVSEDHPVIVIANQARKFGIALWLISQQPEHFPASFQKNVSTTIFLGLHSSSHGDVSRKYNIDKKKFSYLQPQNIALVRLTVKGSGEGAFQTVCVNDKRLAEAEGKLKISA